MKVDGMIDLRLIRTAQLKNVLDWCKGKCVSCNGMTSDGFCCVDGEFKMDKDIWDTEVKYEAED